MKICLLTRRFDLGGAGIGRVSMEIANHLNRQGHDIVSVGDGYKLSSYMFYSLCGIRPKIPSDCNVYHALTPVESLWIPKNKSIVTFHDLFPIAYLDRQGAGIGTNVVRQKIARQYFAFCSAVAVHCKIVVANSTRTKEDIVYWLGVGSDRVRIVRLGISEGLEPQPKVDSTFRIGYLGQLDRRKRVDVLIKAFKESELDAELVIGGKGAEERVLRQLAGGDLRIKFLGFVPDDALNTFYNSLDLFVMPSYVEGYGLPIVEAMACKKPVVVLNDSIIPVEVRNKCAIVDSLSGLFTRLQVLAFSTSDYRYSPESINKILKHYEGEWEIEDNYRFAKEHSWDKTVSEYVNLYKEVLT